MKEKEQDMHEDCCRECGCCHHHGAADGRKDPEEPRWASWLEAACERLETWPFLVVAGLALLASFLLYGHDAGSGWRDPALLAVAICGLPILHEALEGLFADRAIKSSLLVSCAMVACLCIGQTFAAGEVAFIMALGEMLEGLTLRRARKGLQKLVALVPPTAHRIAAAGEGAGAATDDVAVADLAVGDLVRVLPGETIPVDGVVTEGETTVDQSVMTGESLPVDKASGSEVHSGTVNRFGAVTVRVSKADADSSLQKLIRLVREAEARKAPMQRIADKWASILVPASLALAVLVFLGVWVFSGDLLTALVRGVTIMVVFCPCALALATPTSIMAAIGQATRYGVIVKSGEALEKMGRVTTACLDKTGTLTTGRLSVAAVGAFAGSDRKTVLALAAAAEASSEHPLAQAIVRAASEDSSGGDAPATAFRMTPGRGVAATVGSHAVLCGTAAWLAENGAAPSREDAAAADAARADGSAVVFVAADGRAIGYIALADTLRPEAADALRDLQAAGVRPCLLTGDHAATATAVAHRLGIEDVRPGLLPAQKADIVAALRDAGQSVCMVGDGVNDAVALKTADVGIAMGGVGSDIAVEAADIALVGDDLGKLPYLKRLANACVRLIKINIALAMGINAVAILLSILGVLGPVGGALVHNVGSVLVILNAALLYDRKFR